MKKIFTLAICVFSLSAVFAQNYEQRHYESNGYQTQGREFESHDYNANRPHFDFDGHERMHRIIERIRFRYDRRITRVQNNYFMDSWEKQRMVEGLEMQKRNEIREVYERFHQEYDERD